MKRLHYSSNTETSVSNVNGVRRIYRQRKQIPPVVEIKTEINEDPDPDNEVEREEPSEEQITALPNENVFSEIMVQTAAMEREEANLEFMDCKDKYTRLCINSIQQIKRAYFYDKPITYPVESQWQIQAASFSVQYIPSEKPVPDWQNLYIIEPTKNKSIKLVPQPGYIVIPVMDQVIENDMIPIRILVRDSKTGDSVFNMVTYIMRKGDVFIPLKKKDTRIKSSEGVKVSFTKYEQRLTTDNIVTVCKSVKLKEINFSLGDMFRVSQPIEWPRHFNRNNRELQMAYEQCYTMSIDPAMNLPRLKHKEDYDIPMFIDRHETVPKNLGISGWIKNVIFNEPS